MSAASAADIAKLDQVFKTLRVEGEKSMSGLLTQAMVFAIQSAVKATAPGASSTRSGMAKKYKTRPLAPISDAYMYFNPKTKFLFSRPTPISGYKSKGLIRVAKGIKAWEKRKNDWKMIPYIKGVTPEEKRNIPFYGAAKTGFLSAYRQLGKQVESIPDSSKPYSSVAKRLFGFDQYIIVTNEVDYAAIISPMAAETGMQKAAKRMLKTYEATFNRLTERANSR